MTSLAGVPNSWAMAAPSCPRAPMTAMRTSGHPGLTVDGEVPHLLVVENAFPARHHACRDAVAHDVHGGPPHVHDLVDPEEDGGAFERQAELRQRRRQHDEGGSRDTGHAL